MINKLTKVAQDIVRSSGELVKTTKLSLDVSTHEETLRNIYLDIGKKVHEIYMYGGSLGKFFDEKYADIVECEKKIAELKEQQDSIRGVKTCRKCNKTVDRNAEFCPRCGNRVDSFSVSKPEPAVESNFATQGYVQQEAPVPQDSPKPEQKSTINCRLCGAENDNGNKFCLGCGRAL